MSVIDQTYLDSVTLPTADEEIWRYSRIGELDLSSFVHCEHHCDVIDPDGFVTVSPPTGTPATDLFDDTPDVFAEINATSASTVRVTIPAGRVASGPIVVTHSIPGDGSLTTPRLVVDAAADSEIAVIERFVSTSDGPALTIPVVQIRTGPAARVRYLAVNDLSPQAWSIGHQQSESDRDSSLLVSTVALGGDYARVRTEARSIGTGADTRQVALYFADGDQMHDFRVIQDHVAAHTSSDLLFKGAVQDRAASVYTGLISIGDDARGTTAYQTNRTLTLSEGAWAESVPNLDIRTNDVRCSHASTVGPIDEDQRFYLESRGVHPDVAERLVVLGFFDEVLSQLPSTDIAADLRVRVATKLKIGESS